MESQANLGNNMKFVSETLDLDLGFAITLLHYIMINLKYFYLDYKMITLIPKWIVKVYNSVQVGQESKLGTTLLF